MKITLHKLLEQVGLVCDVSIEVYGIQSDSRKVNHGDLFVAVPGFESDGHHFIKSAIDRGAVAIIGERVITDQIPTPYYHVDNTREVLFTLTNFFYQMPQNKHKMIGITGTNGKTTTAYLIHEILSYNGKTSSLLGTVVYSLNGVEHQSTLTTPDTISIQKILHESNDEYVVMEVSSHGLDQYRVAGSMFDYALFTNLSHEHLDYHSNLEDYYLAKKKLFQYLKKDGKAIIGAYNPWGERLNAELAEELIPAIPYCHKEVKGPISIKSMVTAPKAQVVLEDHGNEFTLQLNIVGKHNIYNVLGSYFCARELGFLPEEIIPPLQAFNGVPGRFEIINLPNNSKAIVDYAHTPDGLYHALSTAKECIEQDVYHVFGFRGKRDISKREAMVKISQRLAKQVFLTLDDLNGVEKETMLDDLRKLSNEYPNVAVIDDRTLAIRHALKFLDNGDGLIVTGKGSEKYKDDYKFPSATDKETILQAAAEIN
ncbi:UDP-N-acetylmuramoyl-L-alanyl-D-glutamate--2,6-diaminopimelate ligase [Neobacillus sp. FSL H8-0543]|uniref:UDP-N-acetylmuramoyl-L-alanyl-D-glutamate--2, 6-diaminopimelate ligase n=1 Tax=Neobacillus sp. FSL H8-0543 TaxID=2954672 RepID=UPI0031595B66